MKKTFLLVISIVIGEVCLAQQSHINLDWAPQKNLQGLVPFGANTISPEVHDDHTVTFRYKAPRATEVSLTGDIQRNVEGTYDYPLVPFRIDDW